MTDPAHPHQLRFYLAGVGLYFGAMGIGSVIFPYLVAVKLGAPAAYVGFAQTVAQLPMLTLILFGGVLADRRDARSLLIVMHLLGGIPPLMMAGAIAAGGLTYPVVLVYAAVTGIVGAIIMPARDVMLSRVAPAGNVQKAVGAMTALQFGSQIFGLALGGAASTIGVVPVMIAQGLSVLGGAFFAMRLLPAPPSRGDAARDRSVSADLMEGLRIVYHSPVIFPVIVLMLAIGMLFMGVFQVGLPLMIRDFYQGGSAEMAQLMIAFMAGTIVSSTFLMRRAPVRRQGRALICAMAFGGTLLPFFSFGPPLWVTNTLVFFWGMGAGVSMTMSRTLVQEAATPEHRARILSIFNIGFMGGAPIGTLLMGFLIDWLGPLTSFLVPPSILLTIVAGTALFSRLWRIEAPPGPPAGGGQAEGPTEIQNA